MDKQTKAIEDAREFIEYSRGALANMLRLQKSMIENPYCTPEDAAWIEKRVNEARAAYAEFGERLQETHDALLRLAILEAELPPPDPLRN